MLTPEEVKSMIANLLPCEYLEVEGDGHHFFPKLFPTHLRVKTVWRVIA